MDIRWPHHKDFAFTIIDDTDNATVKNIKPIYDFLFELGIKTSKTIWVYPPRDSFLGDTIRKKDYLSFLQKLKEQGFEIQMHNVGSGDFTRNEIIKGLDLFKKELGQYPSMHINHSMNADNLYWGYKRYGFFLRFFIKLLKGKTRRFYGDEENSPHFWGDYAQKHIKYIRNRVFNGINTLRYDPQMPFKEKSKPYSNYWFSSSDGHTLEEFNHLISSNNIDKLKKQNGLCIVYTHFASGFVDENGEINKLFKANMEYLAQQNAWFAPTSEILDYLLQQKKPKNPSLSYINILDFKWLADRIWKKIKFGR